MKGKRFANHGMKYLEVGQRGGDAVELVQQLRLGIIEVLGTHKAWRFERFAFLMGHKKKNP